MEKFKGFLASKAGQAVVTAVVALIVFGLFMLATETSSLVLALIVAGICCIFGWQTLSFITSRFFLVLPIVGWFFYVMIKFFLSVFIGVFVAPFRIGKMVSGWANGMVNGR